MKYNFGTWLPWWFKRYVMRKKDTPLQPLYQFDKGVTGVEEDLLANAPFTGDVEKLSDEESNVSERRPYASGEKNITREESGISHH
jgi:hypothetical protein